MKRKSRVQQVFVEPKLLLRKVYRIEPCQPNKRREAFSGRKKDGSFVLNRLCSFSYLRFLPVLMLLMCWGSLSNAQNFLRSTPFVSGKGYPYYRTPAIVKAGDGALLAFAEARSAREDDSEGDIVLRRSMDNGYNWEVQQVIAGQDRSQRFGIPIPIVSDGKIILLYTRSRYVERQTDRGCRSILMKTSIDNGKNWSSARDITQQVSLPCREDRNGRVANPIPAGSWGWLGLGPGHGIVKKQSPNKGRILACARRNDNSGPNSYVIYSDDGGSNWRFGSTINQKSSECTLAELPNGDVMLNARVVGQSSRLVAVSRNGGASFGDVRLDPRLPEPLGGCAGSSLRYNNSILFSNPANRNDKTDGTLRRSTDNGLNWPISKRYTKNGEFSAYSDLVRINNGVGVLLEWGRSLSKPHEEIQFLVIPAGELGL